MKEHPILFKAEMVASILAGQKTQTRRLAKPSNMISSGAIKLGFHLVDFDRATNENGSYLKVPFAHPTDGWESDPDEDTRGRVGSRIQVGDLLWVREGWRTRPLFDDFSPTEIKEDMDRCRELPVISYAADGPDHSRIWGRCRSSLHMPRWASRITLNVTGVKVERLQDISGTDALAEGVKTTNPCGGCGENRWKNCIGCRHPWGDHPVSAFRELWISINGAESWESNPWVFAYTFEVAK